MPFTLSHSAAVLPFFAWVSRPLWRLALVIGALSPDFFYYLRRFDVATFAHTGLGSMLVCLPVSILVIGAFLFLRDALLFLLPSVVRQLIAPERPLPAIPRMVCFSGCCLAAWIGAASHLFWDSFTHRNGWAVQRLALLQADFSCFGLSLPLYSWLQQASTLFGAVIVVIVLSRALRGMTLSAQSGDFWRKCFWGGLLFLSLFGGALLGILKAPPTGAFFAFRVWVFQSAVYSGTLFLTLGVFALIMVMWWRRERR